MGKPWIIRVWFKLCKICSSLRVNIMNSKFPCRIEKFFIHREERHSSLKMRLNQHRVGKIQWMWKDEETRQDARRRKILFYVHSISSTAFCTDVCGPHATRDATITSSRSLFKVIPLNHSSSFMWMFRWMRNEKKSTHNKHKCNRKCFFRFTWRPKMCAIARYEKENKCNKFPHIFVSFDLNACFPIYTLRATQSTFFSTRRSMTFVQRQNHNRCAALRKIHLPVNWKSFSPANYSASEKLSSISGMRHWRGKTPRGLESNPIRIFYRLLSFSINSSSAVLIQFKFKSLNWDLRIDCGEGKKK